MKPPVLGGAGPARARHGLVLIHGRWASAASILPLGEGLGLPDLALAAPEAEGNSWWPTSFLAPQANMEPCLPAALAAVEAAIAALEEGGLPRHRIALAGFSQGACLALEYVARRGGALAAVFACSGGLVGTGDAGGPPLPELYGNPDKLFAYQTDLGGLPVRISNHLEDPHIPMARVRRSAEVLAALGADVTVETEPGSHHGVLAGDVTAMRRAFNNA
ncbi:alpha/beta hydrolase [Mangrovicoccus algicola]|uniref:Dienelactone hydrolase family protein n=1 Tax=Mangrovicoccus algicola TaxID=2771008 RepID=A0A8J6Z8Z2_9RHOB|nr:dienelactone hydrolase family protein [Mangrovicoccus algicola]MBE3638081.1 dienelactone hydrolase family protein [Mangrovicoccus algicola]